MKVAYVFATDTAATYKLATMILPQLEDGSHGASGWRRSPPSRTSFS